MDLPAKCVFFSAITRSILFFIQQIRPVHVYFFIRYSESNELYCNTLVFCFDCCSFLFLLAFIATSIPKFTPRQIRYLFFISFFTWCFMHWMNSWMIFICVLLANTIKKLPLFKRVRKKILLLLLSENARHRV